jgi:hypothetical protein
MIQYLYSYYIIFLLLKTECVSLIDSLESIFNSVLMLFLKKLHSDTFEFY